MFSFGNAGFYGSKGGAPPSEPIVGMAGNPRGGGYWMVSDLGSVFNFGAAGFYGSEPADTQSQPVVGMASTADGAGYWLTTSVIAEEPPSTVTPLVLAECDMAALQPSFEPSGIILACGDANARLIGLTWSSWTSNTAAGAGSYTQNNCRPDCAGGTFITYPGASVVLSSPVKTFAGYEFSSVTISYPDPSGPQGRTTTTLPLAVTTG